jgi:hypothetical protein
LFEDWEAVEIDIPQELQWIGPMFAVLYVFLWMTRGPISFYLLFVLPLLLMIVFPPLLIVGVIILYYIYKIEQHRILIIVLILSFFGSGILLQPLPIPYYGPYPPPPVFRVTSIMTPFVAVFLFLFQLLRGQFIVSLSLALLFALSTLTVLTIHRVSQGRLTVIHAMLVLTLILLTWTLLVIPISTMISYYFYTPIPLGPLVAFNVLPWLQATED